MNNKIMLGIIVVLLISFVIFLIKGNNTNGNLSDSDEVQKITIGMKGYNYFPNQIKVNVNQKVQISLDSTVRGCYRSFVIRDFGIAQYLKTPEDYVEFTPTKKGTYRFSCSMGMGVGTIIVE